jgi:phage terminase large subunit
MPVIERRVRSYQQPLHSFMIGGGKRAIEIAHRRWGKDEIALHVTCELLHKRVGNVWHCLPEYSQARKALWTGVNAHTGRRRIDEAFPPEIRESVNDQEMFIRFKNGSTWQMIGSDRYNATVGSGVMGITYSEWALANPSAWAYHRPMLEENNGWAMFITTPRGNNHAKSMLDHARRNPETWFSEVSSVLDTGVLSQEQLDESLAEYISLYGMDMGRAQFEQEYLCSFNAAIMGAYWGGEIAAAERGDRIQPIAIDPNHPVHTAWDLGKAVNNPIWCFQVINGLPRIVDFYRPESDDLSDWCKWLDDQGYHGTDYVPWDIAQFVWGAKRTRSEILRDLGRKPTPVTLVSVADGLTAGRETIKVAKFHGGDDDRAKRVELGIEGLKNYRREWDDELKTFRENPVKDWAEHIGSSFRYLGLAWKEAIKAYEPPPKPKEQEYLATAGGVIMPARSLDDAIQAMINKKRKARNG